MTTNATMSIVTQYLMTMHCPGSGAPQQVDDSLIIYRTGEDGWAKGPRINGTILAPTADWLRVMPGGSLRVDARMSIRTDDGALIYITYNGVISVSRENFGRMAAGATLTGSDMYFTIAPVFQTSHEKYAWLNHAQAIGKVVSIKGGEGGYVRYEVFLVS